MFWRKFRLDWTYAIGELLIVVVGVLIALAINVWNNERLERAQERDFIRRLLSDIEEDQRRFEFQLRAIDPKEDSNHRDLLRGQCASPHSDRRTGDPIPFSFVPARAAGARVNVEYLGWRRQPGP
jgi:hypothetical protein